MDLESASLGAVDYGIFALMLLVSAGIGVYFGFAGGKQKTTEEYLLAGKDMSVVPVAFSLMASFLSAITVIGTPAEMYRYGINMAYLNLGFLVGIFVSGYLFVPVFFNLQASTVYEYLMKRFGHVIRTLTSLAFVAQMILYMAVVLYAPALALSAVTNLSTWTSIVSIGVVCTFYCTLGGMKAVLWTDVFQAILMFLGLFTVLIKGTIDAGGLSNVVNRSLDGGRILVPSWSWDLTTRYTMWNIFFSGFVLSMSSFSSNQVQIQRMLTVKNVNRSRAALFLSIPMGTSFHLLNCFVGLVLYANFYNCDPISSPSKPITSTDQMLPYFMMISLGHYPGLPGLCICGVFSASLSTISSAVNSLSAVTMEDFVRPFLDSRGFTQTKAAFFAKAITVAYGAVCVVLTFLVARFDNLIEASLTVFGMLGGPVLGVFMLGMLTTRANQKGVVIGLLSALAFCTWMSFGGSAYGPPPSPLPVSTDGCPAVLGNESSLMNYTAEFIDMENTTTSSVPTTLSSLLFHNGSLNAVAERAVDDRYIFPLYRVSYVWVTPFGFIICFVVGYIASVILEGCTGEKQHVPPEYLSPAVRWFLCSDDDKNHCEKKDLQLTCVSDSKEQKEKVPSELPNNGVVVEKVRL